MKTIAYLFPDNLSDYINKKTGDHDELFEEELREFTLLDDKGVNWYVNNIEPPEVLSFLGKLYKYSHRKQTIEDSEIVTKIDTDFLDRYIDKRINYLDNTSKMLLHSFVETYNLNI